MAYQDAQLHRESADRCTRAADCSRRAAECYETDDRARGAQSHTKQRVITSRRCIAAKKRKPKAARAIKFASRAPERSRSKPALSRNRGRRADRNRRAWKSEASMRYAGRTATLSDDGQHTRIVADASHRDRTAAKERRRMSRLAAHRSSLRRDHCVLQALKVRVDFRTA